MAYESGADVILTDKRAFHGFLAGAGMGALVPSAASVLLDERGACRLRSRRGTWEDRRLHPQ